MTAIVVVLMALVVIFLLTRVSWVISRRERRSINDYGETLDVLAKLSSQNSPTPSRSRRGPSSPEQLPESDDVGLESGGTEQPHPRSLIGPLQLGNARRLRPLGRPSHAPPGATTSADHPFGDAAGAGAWARPRPHPPGGPDAETPVPVGGAGVPPDRRRDRPAMVFVDDSVVDEPPEAAATAAGATSSGLLPEAPPSTPPSAATESPTPASPPTASPTTESPPT
ncbi:MAG: hypothetical protein J2O38_03455, partial [Acidimicrobiales bacterium]|nr:hypothetical protein [Acidimicrobiales bacterium]